MEKVTHAQLAARSKQETLSKKEAGYVTNAPTQCGSCEYFKGPAHCTLLKTVIDPIHGCCDLWEPEAD